MKAIVYRRFGSPDVLHLEEVEKPTPKDNIGMTKANKEDMALVRELLEAGKLVPVVDKRLPLSEAAESFRYYEEGHAKGRVVITVEHNSKTDPS